MNVVGPAVQQNDRRTIGRTGFGVSDVQQPSINVLQWPKRDIYTRLDRWQRSARPGVRRLHAELYSGDRRCSSEQETAIAVDLFRISVHGRSPLVRIS